MDANPASVPTLVTAITTFNRGNFYDCHDQLEALWMVADPVDKPFYQGLLQVAVGFYHLGNQNWRGAAILLGEGVNRLRPFAPHYQEIPVDSLIDCGWSWLQALQQTGPEMVTPLSQALNQAFALGNRPQSLDLTVNDQKFSLPFPWIGGLLANPQD